MNHPAVSPAVTLTQPTPSVPGRGVTPNPRLVRGARQSARRIQPLVYRVAGLARESGVDPATVRRRIRDGRIRARRVGKWLVIHRREAQRWMEELAK